MAQVQSKKKKLRKEGESDEVPEDDPARMAVGVKIMISRMFAEFEQRKKQLEKQDADAKAKAKEEQAEREFMEALKKREEQTRAAHGALPHRATSRSAHC